MTLSESTKRKGLQSSGSGDAARAHLAAGRAIYYGDARYPDGLVKKYPDGRKELVSVSADGKVSVIHEISSE